MVLHARMQEAAELAHAKALQQLQDTLAYMQANEADGGDNALIIDGKALGHALGDDARSLLLEVLHLSLFCAAKRVQPDMPALQPCRGRCCILCTWA